MDQIDLKILALLQTELRLTVAEISRRVGLSATPCWKRIQRLELDGIIQRCVAVLNPIKLGLTLTAYLEVELTDPSDAHCHELVCFISQSEEIRVAHRLGRGTYILQVIVADMRAYDAFYKNFISIARFRVVTSHFAMETIKSTTRLPINPYYDGHMLFRA